MALQTSAAVTGSRALPARADADSFPPTFSYRASLGGGLSSRLLTFLLTICLTLGTPWLSWAAEMPVPGTQRITSGLEGFNQSMFELERALVDQWQSLRGHSPSVALPEYLSTGLNNALTNLVNEPLTLTGNLIAGDFHSAFVSLQRLVINTTVGLGGFLDIASALGLQAPHVDMGLALCVHGVASGPYVFLPFIGPRTMRDFIMDYVVAYTLYVYIASLITGPSPPILLFIAAKNALWAAQLATMKQMDRSAAAAKVDEGYQSVREEYLRQRDYRCRALAASIHKQWE